MSQQNHGGQAWVESWRRAGRRLAELRRVELAEVSTQQALLHLAGAFESCRLHTFPAPTSGLVQQQRWFSRLRPCSAEDLIVLKAFAGRRAFSCGRPCPGG